MLRVTQPRRSHRVPALLLMTLFLAPPAFAGLSTTGRWTSKNDTGAYWSQIPVHLILTRGTGAYHSQLLWYNSHVEGYVQPDSLLGGVWGWRPDSTTAEADCSSYPALRFTALSHGHPTKNIFCTGHTILGNGQVLIGGGSENETGITSSTIFDPVTRTFAAQDTMLERRWYPTLTTLPSGKAVVTSGSTYPHIWSLGGQSAVGSGSVLSDSLQLFSATKYGDWDPPVKVAPTSADWPTARFGHSATHNINTTATVLFGGRNSTTILDETWFLYRGNDKDSGPQYSALRWNPATSPSERYQHSAVNPSDFTIIVFGGRSLIAAKQDTWQLYKTNLGDWDWQALSPSGNAPSSRHGHSAVWDSQNDCMLVFGGTGLSGFDDAAPADRKLYRLALGNSPAWSEVVPDSDATHGYPSARHGHGMVLDGVARNVDYSGAPDEDHSHRFLLFGGKGASSLLNDPSGYDDGRPSRAARLFFNPIAPLDRGPHDPGYPALRRSVRSARHRKACPPREDRAASSTRRGEAASPKIFG